MISFFFSSFLLCSLLTYVRLSLMNRTGHAKLSKDGGIVHEFTLTNTTTLLYQLEHTLHGDDRRNLGGIESPACCMLHVSGVFNRCTIDAVLDTDTMVAWVFDKASTGLQLDSPGRTSRRGHARHHAGGCGLVQSIWLSCLTMKTSPLGQQVTDTVSPLE